MADRPYEPSPEDAFALWKAGQRTRGRAKPPLPEPQMQALFDVLRRERALEKCDTTLRLVKGWLKEQGLAFERVEAWLHENGGYCDCEVLLNAEPAWRKSRSSGKRC